MWILRAPVRITLLLQGSKWGPQGTTKGKQMENVWWVKKHKRLLCEFCARLSGSHFCCKDANGDPKEPPKEWKWKMPDGRKTETTFMWILRAPVRITHLPQGSKLGPQETAKGMKMQTVWWAKKHKRLLFELCEWFAGPRFYRKDPEWDTPDGNQCSEGVTLKRENWFRVYRHQI